MVDPVHVLVVDDSAVVRQTMLGLLASAADMTTETAADPFIAMEKMRRRRPDVILLDLEMPRMDGLTFMRKVMAEDPIPIVVCSSLAAANHAIVFDAIAEGAVEVVAKPKIGIRTFLEESRVLLEDALRAAALAGRRPRRIAGTPRPGTQPPPEAPSRPPLPVRPSRALEAADPVVAVGASTGGPDALSFLLEQMPEDAPGLVVVQHMPAGFTRAFADRLDRSCRIEVKEAAQGDEVCRGRALIAPGDRQMSLRRTGGRVTAVVEEGPLVSRHRPSVDVLFRSAARVTGPHTVGVLLTGMGADGADGLLELKQAGAATVAQDEQSCIVFGMPREAIRRGAVDQVLPLDHIPAAILRLAGAKTL